MTILNNLKNNVFVDGPFIEEQKRLEHTIQRKQEPADLEERN